MNTTSPLSLKQIHLTGGFWKTKQSLVADRVIPYQWKALNDEVPGAEPSHSIENFRIAAGLKQGEFYGLVFQDSDIGKWIEAAAYSLLYRPDQDLEAKIDGVVELIAQAQQPDGYLQTYFSVKAPAKRWTDFAMGHEMYVGGHLMEGAVAYYEATGKRAFLDVMVRYADHLCVTFGRGPGQITAYDGHPEIELALHKLADATGQPKYRDLAQFFVDERGKHPGVIDNAKTVAWEPRSTPWNRADYYQDHLPVREQKTAEGHAVRAMYLYTAMADQRRHYGDATLDAALGSLWNNVVQHRMYVTGGLGSQAGWERFTIDDDLPSDTAYTETCAAIGLVLWAWRMTLIDPDSRYADILERAIYNGALSGISLDGTRYFYVNPLEIVPGTAHFREDHHHVKTQRVEWFGCACCPPNIARAIASFGQYVYSSGERGVWVHQYAEGEAVVPVGKKSVRMRQTTNYPWDGTVALTLQDVPGGEWDLALRLSSWCAAPSLEINGKKTTITATKGYVTLTRTWANGDTVKLDLPMEVRYLRSSPRMPETFGKIAVQRGPLVWCAEQADNGAGLHLLRLEPGRSRVEPCPELGAGAMKLRVPAVRYEASAEAYSTEPPRGVKTEAVLVPYHLWGNRGEGEMRVWLGGS